MNPIEAIRREEQGLGLRSGVSEDMFLRKFAQRRLSEMGGLPRSMSDREFFDLGKAAEWAQEGLGDIEATLDAAFKALKTVLRQIHEKVKTGALSPGNLPFEPDRPAHYFTQQFAQLLTAEYKGRTLKKGDERDFLHAIMGCCGWPPRIAVFCPLVARR